MAVTVLNWFRQVRTKSASVYASFDKTPPFDRTKVTALLVWMKFWIVAVSAACRQPNQFSTAAAVPLNLLPFRESYGRLRKIKRGNIHVESTETGLESPRPPPHITRQLSACQDVVQGGAQSKDSPLYVIVRILR